MKKKFHNSIRNRKVGIGTNIGQNRWLMFIPTVSVIIFICLISYIIMTTLTVFNAAKRADYEKQIALKTKSFIELESKLSIVDKNITLALAEEKGFEEIATIHYITAKSLSTILMPR